MIRIALDLDDVLFDFNSAYNERFKKQKNYRENRTITRNVQKLRKDKKFWENLPKLREIIDFTPELYCTKRVSSKQYTKNALKKCGFPLKPIYQVLTQSANKANYIKGRADVLIDDSWFNVRQALSVNFPAILITTSDNEHIDCKYRIKDLAIHEITTIYNNVVEDINNKTLPSNVKIWYYTYTNSWFSSVFRHERCWIFLI